jgi:hypothetical protein
MLSAIAQGRTALRRSVSRLPGGREMAKRTTALALGVALLCGLFSALPARAGTTQYNPRRAGHPLRIVAYAAHPIGVALDYLIFRPAWWVGTHEPLRTIFGVQVVVDDSAEVARATQEDFDRSVPLPPPQPTTPDDSQREVPDPQD